MGKRAIVLVVALLLGGAAGFSVLQYVEGVKSTVEQERNPVQVFRAAQGIPEGANGDVVLQNLQYVEGIEQEADLPADAITRAEDLQAVLAGKVAVGPIGANEILTGNQWVALSTDITPMRELLPDGMQALTLSPGEVQGINGFAEPGDHVNVIVTLDIEAILTQQGVAPDFGIPTEVPEGETAPEDTTVRELIPYTRFVLQDLEVLASGTDVVSRDTTPSVSADQTSGAAPADGAAAGELGGAVQEEAVVEEVVSVYTLAVNAEDAEKLVYAIENGTIYLTLVQSDYEPIATRGVTVETLFGTDLASDIFEN